MKKFLLIIQVKMKLIFSLVRLKIMVVFFIEIKKSNKLRKDKVFLMQAIYLIKIFLNICKKESFLIFPKIIINLM